MNGCSVHLMLERSVVLCGSLAVRRKSPLHFVPGRYFSRVHASVPQLIVNLGLLSWLKFLALFRVKLVWHRNIGFVTRVLSEDLVTGS